jgi:Peptidyl-prolyl cis-trans isomerase (rotamase) - cyclophilin family
MRKSLHLLLTCLLTLGIFNASAESAPQKSEQKASGKAPAEAPQVVFQTTLGDLKIALYPDRAPVTVDNFLHYVDSGFYNGVIFHRVIPGFVVQGGGFDQEYQRKNTQAPIANESNNGLRNLRGTLSMARTNDPNSATSQFFINLKDNAQLDYRPMQSGYAVFGKLVEGLEVIDAMAEQPQGDHKGVFENAPNTPVVIERAYRYHPEKGQKTAVKPSTAKPEPTKEQ